MQKLGLSRFIAMVLVISSSACNVAVDGDGGDLDDLDAEDIEDRVRETAEQARNREICDGQTPENLLEADALSEKCRQEPAVVLARARDDVRARGHRRLPEA